MKKYLGYFLGIGIFALAVLISQQIRLVDSEIWTYYLGRHFEFSASGLNGFFWKPLSNLMLKVLGSLTVSFSDEVYFRLGRVLWASFFLLQALLLNRIAVRLGADIRSRMLGLAILFSTRYYLSESLHIRADHFAILFLLLLFELILDAKNIERRDRNVWVAKASLLAFLTICATPKFLPQVFLLFVCGGIFLRNSGRMLIASSLLCFVGLGAVVLLFLQSGGSIRQLMPLYRSFSEAMHSSFFASANSIFVWDQVLYLSPLWLLAFFQVLRVKTDKSSSPGAYFLPVFALTNSAIVLIHPEPYPWYAATTLPFLLLAILPILRDLQSILKFQKTYRLILLLVFSIALTMSFSVIRRFGGFNTQLELMASLTRYANDLGIENFFDSTGLIQGKRHSLPFLTEGQDFDFEIAVREFHKNSPDLVIRTGRLAHILPRIHQHLNSEYLTVTSELGIWVHKDRALQLSVSRKGELKRMNGETINFSEYPFGLLLYFSDSNKQGLLCRTHACPALSQHQSNQVSALPAPPPLGQVSLDRIFSPALGYF